jgi:exonuclease SbcC
MSEELSINRKVKYIRLTNFQNHKDTVIKLEDGLNMLTGSNDNGKSAIVRAIAFVYYGKSVEDCIFWGENFTSVELEFFDGSAVKRIKHKDYNKIEIRNSDETEFKSYKGFGTKYPEVVLDFLKAPIIHKELGYLAYSEQSNKNFLIDILPSHLPNVISSIIGVDDLEEASKVLSTKTLRLNDKINTLENEIQDIDKEIESDYSTLEEDIKSYDLAKTLFDEAEILNSTLLQMASCQELYLEILRKGSKIKKEMSYYKQIIDILSTNIDEIEEINAVASGMEDLYKKIDSNQKKLESVDKFIDIVKPFIDEEKNITSSEVINKSLASLEEYIEKVNLINSQIKNVEDTLENINSIIDEKSEIEKAEFYLTGINLASPIQSNYDVNQKNIKEIDDELSQLNNDYLNIIEEIKNKKLSCSECSTIGGVKI